ncbi:hypothetical protein HAX54_003988 [Datura stramonium]|uniref:Uncharacterized protein n=1 Tax=Datura stramonium TaxID=4076 RepID=A0ABS8WSI7_DATST|nr:hypothetical protein [Datura stramonium]
MAWGRPKKNNNKAPAMHEGSKLIVQPLLKSCGKGKAKWRMKILTPSIVDPKNAEVTKSVKETIQTKEGRTWAGLVAGHKLASKDMRLTYASPVIEESEIVVHLLKEDIQAGNQQ